MTLTNDVADAIARYRAWNDALSSHFFNPLNANRPVYLQVDAEALRKFAPQLAMAPEDAEESFRDAVCANVLIPNYPPFGRIENLTDAWHKRNQELVSPPPYVALLGLCVLAASKMHRDEDQGYASHNYYVHLNKLLRRQGTGQPPDFDTVVTEFWDDLRNWLNIMNRGARGLATAATGSQGAYKYVGYPISQCLLREVDRSHLPEFFTFARVAPGSILDPQDLLGPLTRWCEHSTSSLSSQARHLILDGTAERRAQIAAIVASEAQSWRGETSDTSGGRTAPIVLRLDLRKGGYQFDLQFYPSRPPGFPAGRFYTASGSFDLCPIEDSEWYEPIEVDERQVLDSGIELRQGAFTLRWVVKRTIVLRQDFQDLGAFVSVQQADLGEQLIVLSRESASLERFLVQYAAPGWRLAPGTQGLPSGWRAYLNVVIQRFASSDMFPQFECLIPVQRTSIRLDGGLKLDAATWLAGAEPTLNVSRAGAGPFAILIDETSVLNSSEDTAEVDLSSLTLAGGDHTIMVSGWSRHFRTARSGEYVAPRVTAHTFPQLAHVLKRQGSQFDATYPSQRPVQGSLPPSGELWVTGARLTAHEEDLPENLPQPVVLQGGAKRYILLGPRPGMICECKDPAAPPFRRMHDKPNLRSFEFMPPFQVTWVVRISRHHRSVQLISAIAPVENTTWEGGDVIAWAAWLTKSYRKPPEGEAAGLWQRYVYLARAMA